MNNPQIPEFFSSVIGLGALRAYHPVKKWNRWGNLVTAILMGVGAAVVFLIGVYDAFTAYQLHGPALIDDKLTGPLIIAFILAAIGLLAGWGAYANWKKGVIIYDRGLAYNDRKGLQTWRWEDILSMTSAITRHYHNGIYTGTTHVYTLLNPQGQKLTLADSVSKVEDLAKSIETNIFPLLYARAADQYNTGQPLVFGPVAISKQGIAVGKKTFPWTDVKEVSIQQGLLKVSKKDGGWFSGAGASAAAIPNLPILLSILQQVVGLKVG